jgi:hypothetical protein
MQYEVCQESGLVKLHSSPSPMRILLIILAAESPNSQEYSISRGSLVSSSAILNCSSAVHKSSSMFLSQDGASAIFLVVNNLP